MRTGGSIEAARAGALAASVALAVAPSARAQSAQTEPLALTWRAPAPCADEAALRARVHALLTHEPRAPLVARGEVRRDAAGYALALRVGDGERTLRARSCARLSEAAALVLALALEDAERAPPPARSTSAGASAGDPASADEARTELAPPAASEPTAAPPARTPLRGTLTARATLALGALPGVGLGVGAAGGLEYGALRVELAGSYHFAREAPLEAVAPGVRAAVQLGYAQARGCGVHARARWDVALCGGVELGALAGEGLGSSAPASAAGLWLAALADARAGFSPVAPLWLGAGVGAAVPLAYPRFELAGQRAFEPSPVGLRAHLDVGVRFR